MPDAKEVHGVPFEREQDAVIAQAETEGAGHIAVERAHIAGAGAGEMQDSLKQAYGRGAVQGAHVGLGLIEPLDAVGWHY